MEEQRRIAQLEAERWDRFRKMAITWEEARRLRNFLAALEQGAESLASEIDGMPAGDWLDWTHKRIEAMNALPFAPDDEPD